MKMKKSAPGVVLTHIRLNFMTDYIGRQAQDEGSTPTYKCKCCCSEFFEIAEPYSLAASDFLR